MPLCFHNVVQSIIEPDLVETITIISIISRLIHHLQWTWLKVNNSKKVQVTLQDSTVQVFHLQMRIKIAAICEI